MRRGAASIMLIACLAGCSSHSPEPVSLQVGHHHVRLVSPKGWEHLDHGREQLFRNGESELRMEDLGPATREGFVSEVRAARALWLAGRRGDALARMWTLHGPPTSFLPRGSIAEFWRPWTDVTYIPEVADSASLGRAFDEIIRSAEALPKTPTANLTEWVLNHADDAYRREISHRDSLAIHGTSWLAIDTWNRVTHMDRHRVALLDNGGYLLSLATERGIYERMSGAFDSLLASVEVSRTP